MKLCFFVGPSAGCRIGKNKCPLSALRVISLQQQYVGYRGDSGLWQTVRRARLLPRRKKRAMSMGAPSNISIGSPPTSSSTNTVRLASRTSSNGSTAHVPSSSSFSSYSCVRRSRVERDGWSKQEQRTARRGAWRIVESPAAMKDAFAVLPEKSCHPSTPCSVNAAPPDKLGGRAFRVE